MQYANVLLGLLPLAAALPQVSYTMVPISTISTTTEYELSTSAVASGAHTHSTAIASGAHTLSTAVASGAHTHSTASHSTTHKAPKLSWTSYTETVSRPHHSTPSVSVSTSVSTKVSVSTETVTATPSRRPKVPGCGGPPPGPLHRPHLVGPIPIPPLHRPSMCSPPKLTGPVGPRDVEGVMPPGLPHTKPSVFTRTVSEGAPTHHKIHTNSKHANAGVVTRTVYEDDETKTVTVDPSPTGPVESTTTEYALTRTSTAWTDLDATHVVTKSLDAITTTTVTRKEGAITTYVVSYPVHVRPTPAILSVIGPSDAIPFPTGLGHGPAVPPRYPPGGPIPPRPAHGPGGVMPVPPLAARAAITSSPAHSHSYTSTITMIEDPSTVWVTETLKEGGLISVTETTPPPVTMTYYKEDQATWTAAVHTEIEHDDDGDGYEHDITRVETRWPTTLATRTGRIPPPVGKTLLPHVPLKTVLGPPQGPIPTKA